MAYDFITSADVGKYFHHARVLDPRGRQVLPKRINQYSGSLRKLFGQFLADDASALVIVDQLLSRSVAQAHLLLKAIEMATRPTGQALPNCRW